MFRCWRLGNSRQDRTRRAFCEASSGFVDEEPTTTSDDPQAASSVGLRSSTSASRAGALGEGLPSGVGERSTDNGGQAPSRTGPESEAERGPPPPYPGGAEASSGGGDTSRVPPPADPPSYALALTAVETAAAPIDQNEALPLPSPPPAPPPPRVNEAVDELEHTTRSQRPGLITASRARTPMGLAGARDGREPNRPIWVNNLEGGSTSFDFARRADRVQQEDECSIRPHWFVGGGSVVAESIRSNWMNETDSVVGLSEGPVPMGKFVTREGAGIGTNWPYEAESIGAGSSRVNYPGDVTSLASTSPPSIRPGWMGERGPVVPIDGVRPNFVGEIESVVEESSPTDWIEVPESVAAESVGPEWRSEYDDTSSQRPRWIDAGRRSMAPSVVSQRPHWMDADQSSLAALSDDGNVEPRLWPKSDLTQQNPFAERTTNADAAGAIGQEGNSREDRPERLRSVGYNGNKVEAPDDRGYRLATTGEHAVSTSPARTMGGQSSSEDAARPLSELADHSEEWARRVAEVSASEVHVKTTVRADKPHPHDGGDLFGLIQDTNESHLRKTEKIREELRARRVFSSSPAERTHLTEAEDAARQQPPRQPTAEGSAKISIVHSKTLPMDYGDSVVKSPTLTVKQRLENRPQTPTPIVQEAQNAAHLGQQPAVLHRPPLTFKSPASGRRAAASALTSAERTTGSKFPAGGSPFPPSPSRFNNLGGTGTGTGIVAPKPFAELSTSTTRVSKGVAVARPRSGTRAKKSSRDSSKSKNAALAAHRDTSSPSSESQRVGLGMPSASSGEDSARVAGSGEKGTEALRPPAPVMITVTSPTKRSSDPSRRRSGKRGKQKPTDTSSSSTRPELRATSSRKPLTRETRSSGSSSTSSADSNRINASVPKSRRDRPVSEGRSSRPKPSRAEVVPTGQAPGLSSRGRQGTARQQVVPWQGKAVRNEGLSSSSGSNDEMHDRGGAGRPSDKPSRRQDKEVRPERGAAQQAGPGVNVISLSTPIIYDRRLRRQPLPMGTPRERKTTRHRPRKPSELESVQEETPPSSPNKIFDSSQTKLRDANASVLAPYASVPAPSKPSRAVDKEFSRWESAPDPPGRQLASKVGEAHEHGAPTNSPVPSLVQRAPRPHPTAQSSRQVRVVDVQPKDPAVKDAGVSRDSPLEGVAGTGGNGGAVTTPDVRSEKVDPGGATSAPGAAEPSKPSVDIKSAQGEVHPAEKAKEEKKAFAVKWLQDRTKPLLDSYRPRPRGSQRFSASSSMDDGSIASLHGARPMFSPDRFNPFAHAWSCGGSMDDSWCDGSVRSFMTGGRNSSSTSLMSGRGPTERKLPPHLSKTEKHAVARLKIERADVHFGYLPVRGSNNVYKAELRGEIHAAKAISLLGMSKESRAEVLETFDTELLALSRLNSTNVVKVFGACVSLPEIIVVSEFVEGGTLRDLLNKRRELKNLRTRNRLTIAQDIAAGMKILYEHGMQHRHLSSSAILLTSDLRAKIIGVGLSMTTEMLKFFTGHVQTEEEADEELLWASREVLAGAGFSEKSDVYSFGIVLWEIMQTDGTLPYAGMAPKDVVGAKYNGQGPPIPRNCPSAISSLMQSCWSNSPAERPAFDKICTTLNEACLSLGDNRKNIIVSGSLSSLDGST